MTRSLPLRFQAATFLGSFLAFHLELAAAKELLPRYGGSAYVWTTALMVFQGLVVLAALYAWALLRVPRSRRAAVHVAVVAAGLLSPLVPGPPALSGWPPLRLTCELLRSVGPPFFALACVTAVLDDWLDYPEARRLYAASNAGALAALAAFPLLLEPFLPLDSQRLAWRLLYAGFGVLLLRCRPREGEDGGRAVPEPGGTGGLGPREPTWMLLAAAPSAALLAATNALGLDLAAGPLLWAVPLALYLATLSIGFGSRALDGRRVMLWIGFAAATWLAVFGASALFSIVFGTSGPGSLRIMLWGGKLCLDLGALVLLGLACHRALAESKPSAPARAAGFYGWLAAGAWLGSGLVAVALPLVARRSGVFSLDWLIAVVLAVCASSLAAPVARAWILAGAGAAAAAFLAGASLWSRPASSRVLEARRSFYGIYTVIEGEGYREFYHGSTRHGLQYLDPARRRRPVSYFHQDGPLGEIFRVLGPPPGRGAPPRCRVAVVGLGIGTVAAYSRPGQEWDFYELDPDVLSIARDRFTYLEDAPALWRVALGDARLALAAARSPAYDLLILDAFHGDAMPVHLATREALEVYLRRLAPSGVLLFHVSSRYLDLRPMFAGLAADLGLSGATRRLDFKALPAEQGAADPSTWVALAREPETLRALVAAGWTDLGSIRRARAWTDRHASLLPALF